MDFGAEYGNYNADLTRTIPVNGKFTKRQAEVYNACLAVHNHGKKILKPGLPFPDYVKSINAEMEKQLLKIGLISKSDIKNQDPANLLTANISTTVLHTTSASWCMMWAPIPMP